MGAIPATQKNVENDNTLQHFVADMLSGLLEQIEARSRGMRKVVAAVFLLNNRELESFRPRASANFRLVSYVRNNLVTTLETASMLGSGGEGVLDRGFRDARARYMEVWQELLALLAESTNTGAVARLTGTSGDKQVVKDSLSNFFARLDELEALSRQHPLSRQDADLRDRLSQDVRRLVIPAFSAYAARHAKRVEKCECTAVRVARILICLQSVGADARSSPTDVESRITAMIA